MYEEKTAITIEEVRQRAKETLMESLDQYTLLGDDEGKKVEAIASLYEQIAADENAQVTSQRDLKGKVITALATGASALINVAIVIMCTRKEETEIFRTTTARTVVTAALNRIFRR